MYNRLCCTEANFFLKIVFFPQVSSHAHMQVLDFLLFLLSYFWWSLYIFICKSPVFRWWPRTGPGDWRCPGPSCACRPSVSKSLKKMDNSSFSDTEIPYSSETKVRGHINSDPLCTSPMTSPRVCPEPVLKISVILPCGHQARCSSPLRRRGDSPPAISRRWTWPEVAVYFLYFILPDSWNLVAKPDPSTDVYEAPPVIWWGEPRAIRQVSLERYQVRYGHFPLQHRYHLMRGREVKGDPVDKRYGFYFHGNVESAVLSDEEHRAGDYSEVRFYFIYLFPSFIEV